VFALRLRAVATPENHDKHPHPLNSKPGRWRVPTSPTLARMRMLLSAGAAARVVHAFWGAARVGVRASANHRSRFAPLAPPSRRAVGQSRAIAIPRSAAAAAAGKSPSCSQSHGPAAASRSVRFRAAPTLTQVGVLKPDTRAHRFAALSENARAPTKRPRRTNSS
jgi:hypothetical protein